MSRLSRFGPSRRAATTAILIGALVVAALPILGAGAQPATPSLRLTASSDHVTITKYRGEPIYLDLGVYVAALDGPFEVWATRPVYSEPVQARQIIYSGSNVTTRDLPADALDGWDGFKDFFNVEISKDGAEVDSATLDFCPNGYDRQRVNDSGPDTVSYPDSCSSNPFTKGEVLGIDDGWAVNTSGSDDQTVFLPVGTYDVTFSVDDRFVDLFDLPQDASSVHLTLTVEKQTYRKCNKCPGQHERPTLTPSRPQATVPTDTSPANDVLPDLVALPAWSINANNGKKGERLSFSAAVWDAGAQSMVVEGYRRPNEELMDAYQYFYKDDKPVARAPVGSLEYDDRTGHQHWHFLQFARYSLLDETKQEVVVSKKEAFCLAPTDAIDLTIPGSVWTPYSIGLATACGGSTALWVREVLPLGWGDTYYQSLPGQSFDITDLPNGTYYIEVTANPTGVLYEQSSDNNSELREITIKGKAGHRRVVVPPWNGIETENTGDGAGDGGEATPIQ